MQNENLKREEQDINEFDKLIFSNSAKVTFLLNGFFILLAIPVCFILYHYEILNNKKIWGYSLGMIFVAGYLIFDMYKKYKEINAGRKISEEVIVTSSSYDFLVHYFLFSNGMKIYKDSLKRSKLKKKDISLGTKLSIYYLPKSKFIFSMTIIESHKTLIEKATNENIYLFGKSEISIFLTKGRIRRKTYLKRIAVPMVLVLIVIRIFSHSDNAFIMLLSLVILLLNFALYQSKLLNGCMI